MDTKATSFLTQVPEIENDESAKGAVARIQALEAALNTAFIEREDESASAVVALIAEEHMLMLWPPRHRKERDGKCDLVCYWRPGVQHLAHQVLCT